MNQNLRFIQTAICPDRFVFQDRKLEKLKDLLRNLCYIIISIMKLFRVINFG